MRWGEVFFSVGSLLICIGISLLFPIAIALVYHENCTMDLGGSLLLCCGVGGLLVYCFKGRRQDYISSREGIAIVSLGWVAACAFGALPFLFTGTFSTVVDCLFESVSGFTTTGASVMTEIEHHPKAILMWRSLIQWLGGMGIIVLSLAILPFLGVGGMQLYKAEVPSPVPDKLKPRLKDTAVVLWKVYTIMTVAEILLLLIGGMSLYDAISHAFTTLPTGGFSTKNTSVAHYNSLYIEMVISLFMLLAGINFSLHYQLLKGKHLAFWKDPECRFYMGIVILMVFITTFNIWGQVYESIFQAGRNACFQIVSIITTTGYATADYEKWPAMSRHILLLAMFIGGCAGSTGGGMKCLRILLCLKYCYQGLFKLIHPKAVMVIKIGGKAVPEDVIHSVLGFL
ncbi:potassium transporter TrkG, partial [Desulfobacterales bacterium HSG17]|nr:potassium transporter TrkG [Desulfobacterales bacterium HSG17]